MTAPRSRSAGFSLMEVLVGLTLLALVSVAVTQSVRTGLRVWQSAATETAAAELRQTSRLVESWVARALPQRGVEAEDVVVFRGGERQLSFLVDGQAGRKPAGYSRITLAARPDRACPGGADLVLTWEDVTAAGQFAASASDSRILVRCAEDIRFTYSGWRRSPQGPQFAREAMWTDDLSLPAHIAISAKSGRDEFRISAPLIFSN
ncbi:type II secretion system protein J [Hyphomonas sp.]|uniref:PulJ/GspJ family protein n=1 Tax=Hyphomonas sp. TaxID=87 RepID=UPI00391D2EF0